MREDVVPDIEVNTRTGPRLESRVPATVNGLQGDTRSAVAAFFIIHTIV